MAILTDLPNELLLHIISDISPLDIESFALSCKWIYTLCGETISKHEIVRSRLAGMGPVKLLVTVMLEPELALYPTSLAVSGWDVNPDDFPSVPLGQLLEYQRTPYFPVSGTDRSPKRVDSLERPLLFIPLLNLRKWWLNAFSDRYISTISQIVQSNHEPHVNLSQPLALGRLKEVEIAFITDINMMRLAKLLAMLPSVRKLKLGYTLSRKWSGWRHPHYSSYITEMEVKTDIDSSFLQELISCTNGLQKFKQKPQPMYRAYQTNFPRVVKELKQRTRNSLLYLTLLQGRQCHCVHRSGLDVVSLKGFCDKHWPFRQTKGWYKHWKYIQQRAETGIVSAR